jgi:hypothetical protein
VESSRDYNKKKSRDFPPPLPCHWQELAGRWSGGGSLRGLDQAGETRKITLESDTIFIICTQVLLASKRMRISERGDPLGGGAPSTHTLFDSVEHRGGTLRAADIGRNKSLYYRRSISRCYEKRTPHHRATPELGGGGEGGGGGELIHIDKLLTRRPRARRRRRKK